MAEPLTPGQVLKEKVGTLRTHLLEKHPMMPSLLREIHTAIRKFPEQMTLLEEDEIKVIVNGLMVQTGKEFAVASQKSAGTRSVAAKIKNLGADAF